MSDCGRALKAYKGMSEGRLCGRPAEHKPPCMSGESRTRSKQRTIQNREWLNEYKIKRGCADCGYNQYPEALDCDHLPGVEKCFEAGNGIYFTRERLIAELAKCEVVCANCHRHRTAERLVTCEL